MILISLSIEKCVFSRRFGATALSFDLLLNIYKLNSYLTGNTIHLSSIARNSDH
jgi:hypothetical protein